MIVVFGADGRAFDLEFSYFWRHENGLAIEGVILGNVDEAVSILDSMFERGGGVVQFGSNVYTVKLSSYWVERGKNDEGYYISIEMEVV